MKKFLFAAGIAFSLGLAIVMGTRMSPDATAVVIGIICGVLASIPTSTMLVWVLRQRDKQMEMHPGGMAARQQYGQYPPVVVVNGQGTNGYGGGMAMSPPPLAMGVNGGSASPPNGRNFKVIGQENTENSGDVLPPFWDDL
ncbi:MAG: hypothetical protein AAF485_17790 [Chloroflexota bacterium]